MRWWQEKATPKSPQSLRFWLTWVKCMVSIRLTQASSNSSTPPSKTAKICSSKILLLLWLLLRQKNTETYQGYLGNDYVKDIEALTECDFLTTTQPPTTSISTQHPSTSISTNLVPYITLILLTALLAMGSGNAELNVTQWCRQGWPSHACICGSYDIRSLLSCRGHIKFATNTFSPVLMGSP